MSKMLRTHQNTIGNLVIALLFVGGCIFLLTGSWDTSVSQAAKGCCGGDTTATGCCGSTTSVAATTGGCCGSAERVSDSDDYKCDCLDSGNEAADCTHCDDDDNCGKVTKQFVCGTGCNDSDCGNEDTGICGDKGTSYCNNEYPNEDDSQTTCGGQGSDGNCDTK